MTKTTNFSLNQWDAADPIRRADFNADNAKIDAALAAVKSQAESKADAEDVTALGETVTAITADLGSTGQNARVVYGTYTGTGTYGKNNPTTLTFDFCPLLVLVGCKNYNTTMVNPTILLRGRPVACSDVMQNQDLFYSITVSWTDNGASWYSTAGAGEAQLNGANTTYYYVAIGCDNSAEE